jgi:hypothetical protein
LSESRELADCNEVLIAHLLFKEAKELMEQPLALRK